MNLNVQRKSNECEYESYTNFLWANDQNRKLRKLSIRLLALFREGVGYSPLQDFAIFGRKTVMQGVKEVCELLFDKLWHNQKDFI